ncbi:helix-turn-helix transcriptional regulator [Mesorhizobium sp. B1-1-5]|uniref:helix-turn-helix domain-containing protein n=1 Tax=Mesorhizobium sp. B1-1-5 TaxID=2589979 RepID=UPI002484C3C7|nr:helix-turn-helix transcriptional regulator [Mesorhizobium sp. B1-1-5]
MRTARALLKWSQVRLAAKSNMSEGTIRDFENRQRTLRPSKIAAIRQAFELAGITFASEDANGA